MEALRVLVCLSLICAASADAGGVPIDPRGTRPVEQGTRNEKCATERDWPFCTDDQWGPKCPSGCRILGLMNKDDHDLLKRIEKIRSLLDQNKAKHRSADQASKQTYDYLKERLTTDSGHDNNYYDLAQRLRQRITEMKIKIDRQLRILAALKDRVKDQVVEMQRLEVDIDIKLRSCKGSCKSYTEHTVDHDSYVVLDKHVSQLDAQAPQNIESVKTLYVMKSRLMQDSDPNSNFKTKVVGGVATGEQTVDVFHDVTTNELILEQEGSSSAPATISKTSVCKRLRQQSGDVPQPTHAHTHTHRRNQCGAAALAPLCSDDDWVRKCPSGCRLQGLISQAENQAEQRLRKLCKKAEMYEDAVEKSMSTMTRVYSFNRRDIVSRHVAELKFVERAEGLAKNLMSLREHSSRLSLRLEELKSNVHKQMEELYRTEVHIDMQLRACSGSCRSAFPFAVDHLGFETLRADLQQMDRRRKSAPPPEDVPRVTLQPVDISPPPPPEYRTIPTVRRELLTQFEDIGQNRVVLEELLD